MTLVRCSKLAKLRLQQLKKITGLSETKLIDNALMKDTPYIPQRKIRK